MHFTTGFLITEDTRVRFNYYKDSSLGKLKKQERLNINGGGWKILQFDKEYLFFLKSLANDERLNVHTPTITTRTTTQIRNKAIMPPHHYSTQFWKFQLIRNFKRHRHWKGEKKVKLLIFSDDVTVYVENFKESSKELLVGMGEPGGLPSMGSHRVGHD